MANYQLTQTGAEVQSLLNKVASPDTTPTSSSSALITSGGVKTYVDGHVSVSQNDQTKEIDITVGGTTTSAASMDNVNQLGQQTDQLNDAVFGIPGGEVANYPAFEYGALNANGTKSTATNIQRARTISKFPVNGNFRIVPKSGFVFNVFWFESGATTARGNTGGWNSEYNGNWTGDLMVVVKKTNDGNIGASELSEISCIYTQQVSTPGLVDKVDEIEQETGALAEDVDQLNIDIYGENEEREISPTMKYGVYDITNGSYIQSPSSPRICTRDAIKCNGNYEISVDTGFKYSFVFYDESGLYVSGSSSWIQASTVSTGSHNGYIRINVAKTDDSSISASTVTGLLAKVEVRSNGALERIAAIEDLTSLGAVSGTYIGERIVLSGGKYNLSAVGTLPSPLTTQMQSMAIFGDYIIGVYSGLSTLRASVWNLSTLAKVADLTLPYGNYTLPHANTCCFGIEKASGNTLLPLLYVSQWDGEGGCMVYNITENNGVWSASLIQTIMFNGMDSSVFGSSLGDVLVDDRGFLWTIKYHLNSATTTNGNKQDICKFALPKIADGSLIQLGPTDILEHFSVPFIPINQDKQINGGKMYVGAGSNSIPEFVGSQQIVVIDLTTQQIVTIVNLASYGGEVEALAIDDGKMYMTFATNYSLRRLKFD